MTIDLAHFTPWASLAGGLAIGLAAALLVLGTGRIAGIAGIVGGLLQRGLTRRGALAPLPAAAAGRGTGDTALRLAFVVGLFAAPWLWRLFAPLPVGRVDVGPGGLLLAGLLVGVGVRLGSGCTSGHGVCGLARGSRRSAVNVAAFMAAGAAMVFVLRHLGGAA